jgi:hypothetical protein
MKRLLSTLATLSLFGGMGAVVYGVWLLSPPVAITLAGAFLLFVAFLLELLSLKAGKR